MQKLFFLALFATIPLQAATFPQNCDAVATIFAAEIADKPEHDRNINDPTMISSCSWKSTANNGELQEFIVGWQGNDKTDVLTIKNEVIKAMGGTEISHPRLTALNAYAFTHTLDLGLSKSFAIAITAPGWEAHAQHIATLDGQILLPEADTKATVEKLLQLVEESGS